MWHQALPGYCLHWQCAFISSGLRGAEKELPVTDFKEEHGLGISGTIEGKVISIGRYKWIQEMDHKLTLEIPSDLSLSVVAVNGKFAGFFKLDDNLKAETPKVISMLQKSSFSKIKIISGQHEKDQLCQAN